MTLQEMCAWIEGLGRVGYERPMMDKEHSKLCVVCGREIRWRKKWERDWEAVRYCSKSCRSRKRQPLDLELEMAITELLSSRAAGATICPSEAARAVRSDGWRDLMEPCRMAARRLAGEDRVEVVQRGRVVDPSTARGPIRIRLVR